MIADRHAVGLLLGLINGALIAFLGIPPIVVTLGTLAIYRGMIIIIAGRRPGERLGDERRRSRPSRRSSLLGLTTPVWIAHRRLDPVLRLPRTTAAPGRGLYAVGGNPVAARYCGIDQRRQQLLAYAHLRRRVGPLRLSLGGALRRRLFRDRQRL